MEKKGRVKQHYRKGKLVKAHNRKNNKKRLLKSVIRISSALGVSATSYLILKKRYNDNLKKSAKFVLEKAQNIKVPNIDNKALNRNNINFAVGGLWYNKETRHSTELAKYISSRFKGHTVPINTDSFNTLGKKIPNPFQVALDMKFTGIKNGLLKGYNPTARELAAEMYAYHQKYPEHTMVAFGHSTGGTIANEALLILEQLEIDKSKFKLVTLGSNNYGILKPYDNSLNLVDINDWQANPFTFSNATKIGVKKKKKGSTLGEKLIEDHGAYHYISSQESRKKINDFIEPPKDWKKQDTINQKKKKNQENKEGFSKDLEVLRKLRAILRNNESSLRRTIQNDSIPKDKQQLIIQRAKEKVENSKREYESKKVKIKTKIKEEREKRNKK